MVKIPTTVSFSTRSLLKRRINRIERREAKAELGKHKRKPVSDRHVCDLKPLGKRSLKGLHCGNKKRANATSVLENAA